MYFGFIRSSGRSMVDAPTESDLGIDIDMEELERADRLTRENVSTHAMMR
jgi:hypothetical protein